MKAIERVSSTLGWPSGRAALALFALLVVAAFTVGLWSVLPEGATLAAKPARQIGGASSPRQHAEEQRRAELSARFRQGVAMMQIGEYQHAITAFHRVLELEPTLPEAHVNMGFAFFELKDHTGALRFFDGALALASQQGNAHYGRALALKALGRELESVAAMRRFLELSPADDPFRGKAESVLAELNGERPRTAASSDTTTRGDSERK